MSASRDLGLGGAGLCRCVHGTLLVSSRAEAALCPQASTASGGPLSLEVLGRQLARPLGLEAVTCVVLGQEHDRRTVTCSVKRRLWFLSWVRPNPERAAAAPLL